MLYVIYCITMKLGSLSYGTNGLPYQEEHLHAFSSSQSGQMILEKRQKAYGVPSILSLVCLCSLLSPYMHP